MSSEDIFDRDPLLIKQQNQREYGSEVLRNLLVRRTVSTSRQIDIDLHDPQREEKLKRRQNARINVTEVERQAYADSRTNRTRLDKGVRNKLQAVSMVSRGEETELRRPRTRKEPKNLPTRAEADTKFEDADVPLQQRLRIAAVGFRVKIGLLERDSELDENLAVLPLLASQSIAGLPGEVALDQLNRSEAVDATYGSWTQTIADHVQTAVNGGSQLVVLPEFALPPANGMSDVVDAIRNACTASTKRDTQNRQCDHLVFAGSRHDGAYNRGLLLHLKDGVLSETFWHYKVAPARGLGENVLGPGHTAIPSYIFRAPMDGKHVDLNVYVAICYDSFDPSMFLSLVLNTLRFKGNRRDAGRIILVPSFNPSPLFVSMLRDLSFLAQCPVLYVNGLHGDARMFISGFAVRDLLRLKGSGLVGQIERARTNLQTRSRQFKKRDEKKKSKAGYVQRESDREYIGRLENAAKGLERLALKIRLLDKCRSLEYLITVEDCEECGAGHRHDYSCSRDILYYNLDWELVLLLAEFRSIYHAFDDSFLPEPLRAAELKKAYDSAKEKWDAK